MKKLLFMLGLAMMSLTVSAEEESESGLPDGILALEWKFNPFDYESKPVKVAQLNARLFMDAKNAVRFGIGVGFDNNEDTQTQAPSTTQGSPITDYKSTVTNNATTLKLSLGYEYHFASTGRLDFYGGIEGGYLGRFYNATKETGTTTTTVSTSESGTSTLVDYKYETLEYDKRNADGDKYNENGFFGTLFTGVDFYVYKKLYVGAELGITYNMGKKSNGNYTHIQGQRTTLGANVVTEWASKYSSETGITIITGNDPIYSPVEEHTGKYNKVYIEPAIRIGWMF